MDLLKQCIILSNCKEREKGRGKKDILLFLVLIEDWVLFKVSPVCIELQNLLGCKRCFRSIIPTIYVTLVFIVKPYPLELYAHIS